MPPISAKESQTALLLIDIQNAFRVPNFFSGQRNNDLLEVKVSNLVDSTRRWNEKQQQRPSASPAAPDDGSIPKTVEIIHVHHHSTNPESPLHPSYVMPLETSSSDEHTTRGIDPLSCARVVEGERVFAKQVNSAFIGTTLAQYLQENRIRQLLVFGITTDHCVSTSVRMAANLNVVDSLDGEEQGQIWIVEDACATFPRGSYPADLVHKLHVESLRDEFAGVTTVDEVLKHVLVE